MGIVAIVYLIVWRGSYILFAPEIEPVEVVAPDGQAASGETITLSAIVRNTGQMTGTAFAVAVLGSGVEVEGSSVEVPPGDSVEVPVQVSLGSGDHTLSLVVFAEWRGVRRLQTYGDLQVQVGTREIDVARSDFPSEAVRGETFEVSLPWSNRGSAPQVVTPVLVFRPQDGGLPVPVEGTQTEIVPGQDRALRFVVDTWVLRPGRYLVDLVVRRPGGQILGRGSSPLSIELLESS